MKTLEGKKMANDTTGIASIWFHIDDKRRIEQLATEQRMSFSNYVRQAVLREAGIIPK